MDMTKYKRHHIYATLSTHASRYPSFACRAFGSIGPEETEAERLKRLYVEHMCCLVKKKAGRLILKALQPPGDKDAFDSGIRNVQRCLQHENKPPQCISNNGMEWICRTKIGCNRHVEQEGSDMCGGEGQELGDFCCFYALTQAA
eukprot:scaffold4170_cov79-Cylindrotheca_fusiformis.AAC.4